MLYYHPRVVSRECPILEIPNKSVSYFIHYLPADFGIVVPKVETLKSKEFPRGFSGKNDKDIERANARDKMVGKLI